MPETTTPAGGSRGCGAPPAPLPDDVAAAFAEGLRSLADVSDAWAAPALAPATLLEHTERLCDPQAVREALERFATQPGCCGWIETPQALHRAGEGGSATFAGTPLHAELACGRAALHLRWTHGAWLLTRHQESHPEGQACWAQQAERLSSLPGVARWQYRVFMRAADDGTLRVFAARLAGAEPSGSPGPARTGSATR